MNDPKEKVKPHPTPTTTTAPEPIVLAGPETATATPTTPAGTAATTKSTHRPTESSIRSTRQSVAAYLHAPPEGDNPPPADALASGSPRNRERQMLKEFRCILITSFVMDAVLLIVSLLVVHSYKAVARDFYLDNGTLRSTEDFIAAVQGPDFANTPRADSEAGMYISGITSAICIICLLIDAWCFLVVKSVYERATDRDHSLIEAWVASTWFLALWGFGQFLVVLLVVAEGKQQKQEQVIYIFPADIDYSLQRDKWNSSVTWLKVNLYVNLCVGCLVSVCRPIMILFFTDMKKDVRHLDQLLPDNDP